MKTASHLPTISPASPTPCSCVSCAELSGAICRDAAGRWSSSRTRRSPMWPGLRSKPHELEPPECHCTNFVRLLEALENHRRGLWAHGALQGRDLSQARPVMFSGSRRRHIGALASGRPSRCRKYQHIGHDNRPCANYGSVDRPHRGPQHLNRPEHRRTCAEVRRYEDARCRPSETVDGRSAHRDQATACVGVRSFSVIVTRSVLAFSHS
jgi:hypothetical protein